MVFIGGQQEVSVREASMTVVGQLTTIMALTSTVMQTDSLAAWAVQTEHASMTLATEVA
jgi:uncharacterized protein (DUF849 family)